MAETMNMMEVTVDTFCREIKMDLEDEIYEPIIGIGKSGVGKTMSIYELTQEMGIGFCELRLVTLTEVDMLGIPDTVTDADGNKRTTYASNELLPDVKRDGESGILVLDEITSATSTVRAAAYQLLDSKRALGNYKLPPKWKVIALGNGIDDGGVFSGMEAAFLSRATCYRIEPNTQTWVKWAMNNGVNPSVIAFLKWKPECIHVFDPDEMASIFPCPRSWTALSTKLNSREKRNKDANGESIPLSIEDVELYAGGAVGAEIAPTFSAFYSYKGETISPEDILSGKSNPADIVNLRAEIIHLTIQSLTKQVIDELGKGRINAMEFKSECVDRIVNLANWLIKCPKLDYSIMTLTDLKSSSRDFIDLVMLNDEFDEKCPQFMKYCTDNKIVFKA